MQRGHSGADKGHFSIGIHRQRAIIPRIRKRVVEIIRTASDTIWTLGEDLPACNGEVARLSVSAAALCRKHPYDLCSTRAVGSSIGLLPCRHCASRVALRSDIMCRIGVEEAVWLNMKPARCDHELVAGWLSHLIFGLRINDLLVTTARSISDRGCIEFSRKRAAFDIEHVAVGIVVPPGARCKLVLGDGVAAAIQATPTPYSTLSVTSSTLTLAESGNDFANAGDNRNAISSRSNNAQTRHVDSVLYGASDRILIAGVGMTHHAGGRIVP
jgi:hypothetical protein